MNVWKTYTGEILQGSLPVEVEKIIINELEQGNELKLCIGTDSQVHGNRVDFATVVVFVRKKKGGRMLVSKFSEHRIIPIRERMLLEVTHSIGVAYELMDILTRYEIGLEVHADINSDPKFKSEPSLAEAKGYILGMGFEFKGKPDAFASSSCADKVVD